MSRTESAEVRGWDVPVLNTGCRFQFEAAQGCYVILYPEGMVKLNATAAEIMRRCDGAHSVSMIVEELKDLFTDAEAISDHVKEFLVAANERQWIRFQLP